VKRAYVIVLAIVIGVTMTFGTALAADMKLLNFRANTTMANMGHDKTIVKAVKAQNKKGMTLREIQITDGAWKGARAMLGIQEELMSNDCAKAAQALLESQPYIMEIFVMDNQGANVCMTDKTGDYWQGDEGKFVNSYDGGTGSIFVDEIELDDATRANVSQVSVPVIDKGVAIGAMTIGVYVDYLN